MAAIVGLLLWSAVQPSAKEPWKILAFSLSLLVSPVFPLLLNFQNQIAPLKFDACLQDLDQCLGLTAFQVARSLSRYRAPLAAVYVSLFIVMMLWYGLNLKTAGGRPRQLLWAYLTAFAIGPVLYMIVPACGPRYAFASFPNGNPSPPLALMPLNGVPNAIPSLHMTTALIMLYFSRGAARWLAAAFAVLTAAATIVTGEHYLIDLLVAVPFTVFVVMASERKRAAIPVLVVVITILAAIRVYPRA